MSHTYSEWVSKNAVIPSRIALKFSDDSYNQFRYLRMVLNCNSLDTN